MKCNVQRSLVILMIMFLGLKIHAQKTLNDSLEGFDRIHFQEHLSQIKDRTVRDNYIKSVHRNFIKQKYNLVNEKTFVPLASSTSTCGNFDFEDGTPNGWTIAGDYQIMSGVATDPFGNFPVVCPGGNFSLRLNDNNTNASTCSPPGTKTTFSASASRMMGVSSGNFLVKVNFAGATLNFPHSQSDAARIRIEFYDQFNNLIPTPTYTTGYCNPPGSIVSTAPTTYSSSVTQGSQICNYGQYPVTYYPWQTQTFNLSSYIGQNVKLKLSADWCLYQYDWAYAYFDVCCDSSCAAISPGLIATYINNICDGGLFQTELCSNYPGNINYQWSTSATNTTGCESVVSMGSYTLTSNPLANPNFTVNEVFNFFPPIKVNFSLPYSIACSNSSSGVPLFAYPPGGTFSGPGVTTSGFDPWLVANGTYSITYTYTDSISGCSASSTQTIQVITCTSTGINQLNSSIELLIAPNPFSNEILINYSDLPGNTEFVLFNTIGQEILRKTLSDGRNSIETEGLPPGLYTYSLLSQNKQVKQGKLVKE